MLRRAVIRKVELRFFSTLPDRFKEGEEIVSPHVRERLQQMPFKQGQRLQIPDVIGRNTLSGIKATVFGGTSTIGMMAGAMLTETGSRVIYPYRNDGNYFDKRFRENKVVTDLGNKFMLLLEDFTDPRELKLALSDSNTVVCTIGSPFHEFSETQSKKSNYYIPVAIAQAIAETPTVQRAIFIGAAGADPTSPSPLRRNKYYMEKEVRRILPWATILRPTRMYDTYHPKNTWAGRFALQVRFMTRKMYCTDPLATRVQPVYANDVALAIYHCIKYEETMGKNYDLGGPQVYEMKEILELLFNVINMKPHVIPTTVSEMFQMKQHPFFSPRRFLFRQFMSPDWLIDETIDHVVQKGANTFEDLYIKPISFGYKAAHLNEELYYQLNTYEWTQKHQSMA